MKPTTDKSKHERISIRTKIFVCFLFIVLVALALLWLCQVILFEVVYNNVRINEIKATAKHVLLYCDEGTFYSQLAQATEKNDICAAVLTANGSLSYSALNTNACLIHDLSVTQRQELVEQMDGISEALFGLTYDPVTKEYEVNELSTLPFSSATNAIYICSFTHDGESLYLLLDGVISPVGTVTKTSASFLIILSILLVPTAVLLANALSKVIATPISEISHQAKNLSKGAYTPVENNTREIAELNEALLQANQDLKQVDHLRQELIANISHDLRTPLTLISGYLEMMHDLPDEITEENFNTVISETNRLTSLVNDMLDISRLESGTLTPKPQRFSLTENIAAVVKRYEELTHRDGYVFSFEASEDAYVVADPTLIMQVVTNLINNAMTYTGEDKQVTVTQSIKDQHVRIEVTDTGSGIDPEKLPLIWDRYYKVDDAHKRAAKGTGLGLSIVRSIVTLHGGRYGVRVLPEKGTTFWFELSLDTQEPNEPNDPNDGDCAPS